VALIAVREITPVEALECVEEEETPAGLGGIMRQDRRRVSLPDSEFGEVALDAFGLKLTEVQHHCHEARRVSVVVGLVALNPATVEAGQVGNERNPSG